MGTIRTAMSDEGKLILVFQETDAEGTVIDMDLPVAKELFKLLFQLIQEAEGVATLKTAPKVGRGTSDA